MRRQTLLLAVLVGVCGPIWTPTPDLPAAPYHYDRIRLGMTPREVAAVVGLPPGDYDYKHPCKNISMGPIGECVLQAGLPRTYLSNPAKRRTAGYAEVIAVERWTWEDYWIWVAYDANERVVGSYLYEEDEHMIHRLGIVVQQ